MLKFYPPYDVIEGLQVYQDDSSASTFYVLPNQPRFRIDNGLPVFKFLKYRNPIDRPGGKKGGGFCIFDVEFTVPDEQLEKIKAKLQERLDEQYSRLNIKAPQVQIGTLNYTKGTAGLQFLDSGGAMVEKISNPGGPSLFGKMITPFTVELSETGVKLAEDALQDKGGVVQVAYDLFTWVKLPPVQVTVWFNADKFMSFHQEVDIDWSFWGDDSYKEKIEETFRSSESGGVIIDPGAVTDQKVLNQLRDWGWNTLEDAVKRMVLGDIAPVGEDGRKVPDGIEHVTRDVIVHKVASFRRTYKEGQVIEWNPAPRGTLPNITSLTGPDGKPFKWDDFAKTVDLDDPFFKQINVMLRANADFEQLPIDSIEAHVEYKQGGTHEIGEYLFRNSNDVGKFASYIENDNWKYKYWYEVNYKAMRQTFKSPEIVTDEKILTINVDDAGILIIDMQPGDLNFSQVSQAQVTLQYDDTANGVEFIEEMFTLDKDHTKHRLQKLIFQPLRNPYRYRVKYFMSDGKEYQVEWKEGRSQSLFINDPFSNQKTVSVRAFGDFVNDIDNIFLDMVYTDEANGYSQTKSIALNNKNTFFEWTFPIIDEKNGKVMYSGNITKKSGTNPDTIPETVAKGTILIGEAPPAPVEVQVLPDLLDYDKLKLVKVFLHYEDPANSISETKDVIFRKGDTKAVTWQFHPRDRSKVSFQWQTTFFLADGSSKKSDMALTTEMTVIPEFQ